MEPAITDWDDDDLALGLARTYRWGGHSAWELPLSVAQHSLTVLALRRIMEPQLGDDEALRELLHDVEEGFLSWDLNAPLKPHLWRAVPLARQQARTGHCEALSATAVDS